MKKTEEIIKEFWQLWGEAPVGSLKYKKGKSIEAFLTRAITDIQREMVDRCIQTVEELEIRSDDGGDYITDDTELMRSEVIAELYELQSPAKTEGGEE